MKRMILSILCALGAVVLSTLPANAQATRTWVSGVGDDANPCSRTAPCKTFAGAISKTQAGGEINCLDPGGYGAVTVTKSITIDCEDTQGSILASGTTGVIVNGANIIVNLRGLSINGAPPTAPGLNGVRLLQASVLHIEKCFIIGFTGAAPNGNGIIVNNTAGTPELTVIDTTLAHNGVGSTSAGILIKPSGSGGAKVQLSNVSAVDNIVGISADGTATTGTINVMITDSEVAGSSQQGILALTSSAAVNIMIDRTSVAHTGSEGLRAQGANARMRFANSNITGNGTGTSCVGCAALASYGNNHIDGNTADGPNPPVISEK